MEYVHAVWEEFLNFIGGRGGLLHWLLFGAALACCFFWGKRERRLLVWPSVLVLLLFFNPVFFKYVGTRFLTGVYWRLLWMLPISFVIAYTLTRLAAGVKRDVLRVGVIVLACVCIAVSGRAVFTPETYREKENEYELPDAAIHICDYVMGQLQSWKETVIVPNELLCSIRQYSTSVCLLYGRNAGGFISDIGEEEAAVYAQMSSETPDVAFVTRVAGEKNCRFIVFNTDFHRIPEDLTGYGYELAAVIDDVYAVYRRAE